MPRSRTGGRAPTPSDPAAQVRPARCVHQAARLIVRQRLTSRFVSTSRARKRPVARAGSVRSLVRVRHILRWAKKAVFDGGACGGEHAVGFLLAVGELAGAGGLVAGDDDRGVGIVVQAEEAEVGQGAETGGTQLLEDVVAAGGGDVVGAAGAGPRRSRSGGPSCRSGRGSAGRDVGVFPSSWAGCPCRCGGRWG